MDPERSSFISQSKPAQSKLESFETATNADSIEKLRLDYLTKMNESNKFSRSNRLANWWSRTRIGRTRSGLKADDTTEKIKASLDTSRTAYENGRNRYIQLAARKAVEESLTDKMKPAEVQEKLANEIAAKLVDEYKSLTDAEVQQRIGNKNWLQRHPWARAAIGIGLNLGVAASVATANPATLLIFSGAKVAMGAYGMEGAIKGVSDRFGANRGLREKLTPAKVDAITSKEDILSRIASFTEYRISKGKDGKNIPPADPTENLLMDRYQKLVAEELKPSLSDVKNWKKLETQSARVKKNMTALETEKASIDKAAEEKKRNDADNALSNRKKYDKEITDLDTEQKKIDLTTEEVKRLDASGRVIEADMKLAEYDATTNPVGLLQKDKSIEDIRKSLEEIYKADQYLKTLPAGSPNYVLAEKARNNFKLALTSHVTSGKEEEVISAYQARKNAHEDQIAAQEQIDKYNKLEKEIADKTSARDAINEAEEQKKSDEANTRLKRLDSIEKILLPRQKGRIDKLNQVSKDQAIMIYDILMGTPNTATADELSSKGRITDGYLTSDNLINTHEANTRKEISKRRAWSAARWGTAIAASVALNAIPFANQWNELTTAVNFDYTYAGSLKGLYETKLIESLTDQPFTDPSGATEQSARGLEILEQFKAEHPSAYYKGLSQFLYNTDPQPNNGIGFGLLNPIDGQALQQFGNANEHLTAQIPVLNWGEAHRVEASSLNSIKGHVKMSRGIFDSIFDAIKQAAVSAPEAVTNTGARAVISA